MTFQEFLPRCEADLYGFSVWLASFLGLKSVPQARRGYTHGWFWYEYKTHQGLSRALTQQHGESLVQDQDYAYGLTRDGITCFAAGLPFEVFYSQMKECYSGVDRSEDLLVVPRHSIRDADYSDIFMQQLSYVAERRANFSVLLSYTNLPLINAVRRYTGKIEVGAGANEIHSFDRLARIFHKYHNVVTFTMGSPLLYGSMCGAKVGINYVEGLSNHGLRGSEAEWYERNGYGNFMNSEVFSRAYLEDKFPGILCKDFLAKQNLSRDEAIMHPRQVASLLGWEL